MILYEICNVFYILLQIWFSKLMLTELVINKQKYSRKKLIPKSCAVNNFVVGNHRIYKTGFVDNQNEIIPVSGLEQNNKNTAWAMFSVLFCTSVMASLIIRNHRSFPMQQLVSFHSMHR